MHINFATRIVAERFLSLLQIRHSAVRSYRQTNFGEIYQFIMFASKSFKKNVFELEILNANTSRLEG